MGLNGFTGRGGTLGPTRGIKPPRCVRIRRWPPSTRVIGTREIRPGRPQVGACMFRIRNVGLGRPKPSLRMILVRSTEIRHRARESASPG